MGTDSLQANVRRAAGFVISAKTSFLASAGWSSLLIESLMKPQQQKLNMQKCLGKKKLYKHYFVAKSPNVFNSVYETGLMTTNAVFIFLVIFEIKNMISCLISLDRASFLLT